MASLSRRHPAASGRTGIGVGLESGASTDIRRDPAPLSRTNEMPRRYRYGQSGNIYICFDQSYLRLFRLLWSHARPFGLDRPLLVEQPQRLIFSAAKAWRILRLIGGTVVERYGLKQPSASTVSMPHFGNVALRLRIGGYKFFDLASDTVITAYSSELSDDIVQAQIARVREASQYAFSPAARYQNVAGRFYAEAYINGYPLSMICLDGESRLRDYIVPIIGDIIAADRPENVGLQHYVSALKERIMGNTRGFANPVLSSCLAEDGGAVVRDFVEETCAVLQDVRWKEVLLVPTHGDLHPGNVLLTETGVTLIDWENFQKKSVLYDLHTVLFRGDGAIRRPKTASSWDTEAICTLRSRIEVSVDLLRARLRDRSPEFALHLEPSSEAAEAYRHIFYLEFFSKAIEKFWEKCEPVSLRARSAHTRIWAERFAGFERGLAQYGADRASTIR
jgi:hypothetical protein